MPSLLRTFIFTLLLFLFNQFTFAQHWRWVKSSTGTLIVVGHGIAVDGAGNSFITGYFTETVTFGNTTLTSSDQEDVFLVKYDSVGEVVWVKSLGGMGRDFGFSIVLDKLGNIFITGGIKASGLILNESDIFIAKYDPDGKLIWTQTAGGTGTDVGADVAVDAAGNLYVSGRCGAAAVFGDITLASDNADNVFLAKFDPAGKVIWVKSAAGTYETFVNNIGLDVTGNIYLAGSFKNATTIGNISLTVDGFDDLFLAKYDPNGNVIWAKRAGGPRFDYAQNLAVDAVGNCYLTGTFNSVTAQFDGLSLTNSDSNGDHRDIFIVKYDAAGQVKWVNKAGGFYMDQVSDIALDATGNSYIIGYIWETATFGTTTLNSNRNQDIFIAKLNPAGEFVWAKQAGGPLDDDGNGITVDRNGNGYITGAYNRTATFDSFKLRGPEGNMFIAKFGPTSLPEPIPEPPLEEVVFLPNIITPNGDGLNDTFVPLLPGATAVALKVFNRWGQPVYEQVNYQNTWNGGNLATGTYFYLLTNADGEIWKGWIEISR